ncbi:MAG: hypothetical protein SGJ09_18005 [Phycisphaerae bacterium]|nr:hypothetical protein [Phycisphaerae bacterium]
MDPRATSWSGETARSGAVAIAAWVGARGESLAAALAGDRATEVEAEWRWNLTSVGGERRAAAAAWASRTGAAEAGSARELARPEISTVLVLGSDAVSEDDDLRFLLEGERTVVLAASGALTLATAIALGDRLGRVVTVPALASSQCWRVAQPLIEELCADGPVSSVSLRYRARTGERSVDALLVDACDICVRLLPAVESVVALGRNAADSTDVRSLSALVRASSGATATIDLADGGGWLRECELLGAGGRVRLSDTSIERWDRSGERTEFLSVAGPNDVVHASIEALRTVALSRPGRADPERMLAPLALAEAAKLSVRTGNHESPDRVCELARRP